MISTIEIDKILATFKTKEEKINYLNTKIYEYEQSYQESLILDKERLDRLIELTKEEEEQHQQNIDRGGLPRYFNNGDNDLYAQRKKIEGRQKLDKAFAETLKILKSKIENDIELKIELSEHIKNYKSKSDLFIDSFVNDDIFKENQYNYLAESIKKYGYFTIINNGKDYKVYSPALAYLFTSKDLKVTDRNLKTEVIFDNNLHMGIYFNGYNLGEMDFEKEYTISLNVMYGENAQHYIKDLHQNYFHVQHKYLQGSWDKVKKTMPIIITHQLIFTLGYYSGIINKVDTLASKHPDLFVNFYKCEHSSKKNNNSAEQETINSIPILNPQFVEVVFDLIKDFFSSEKQEELKQILETGKDASQHLIFLDNGNRLADAFKQLKKADVITGCDQKELESWILKNFKYKNKQQIKEFKLRYLNDIISTNKDKCQNPILNVTIEKTTGEIKITKA